MITLNIFISAYEEAIIDAFTHTKVLLSIMSQYFDQDIIGDNPIKFINKIYYFNINYDTAVSYDLYMQRNTVNVNDNWFLSFFGAKTY
jgi:hypothetical protein